MTASEIMPLFVNTTQDIFTMTMNAEIFDDISLFQIMVGFLATAIVIRFIIWMREPRDV